MRWEPVVSVCLPYPVSANRYWGERIVRPKHVKGEQRKPEFVHHYTTPEARQYRTTVGWLLRQAGVQKPLQGRVRVDLQLHPHCPLDWRKRMSDDPLWWADDVQRLDLDNARKVVNDSLNEVAIVDDFWIWKDTGEVMEPDERIEACVVVRISRCIQDHPQAALDLVELPQPRPEVAFP